MTLQVLNVWAAYTALLPLLWRCQNQVVGLPVQPCCRCYGGAKIRFTYQRNIIIFFTFLKSQAYEYHFSCK